MSVTITIDAQKLLVASPYVPEFPAAARNLGGRWDGTAKTWVFDLRDEDAVRALCLKSYGDDGLPQSAADTVIARVTVEQCFYGHAAPIYLAGRLIARAFGRDSGAKPGKGIVFLEGAPNSGGSMKNWKTVIPAGSVFEIRDLPRVAAERLAEEVAEAAAVELIENAGAPVNRAALTAERDRLGARLAEIEAALNGG